VSAPVRIGGCELWQGDCREVLQGYPSATFDVIVADPPYAETALDWDKHVDGWLDACSRVMKPSASLWCFGSLAFFMERAADFRGWTRAQDVVWEKHNGSGFAADRFKRIHEHAVQFYPAGRFWADVYKLPQLDPKQPKIGGNVRHRGQPPHTGKIGSAGYDPERERMMRSIIFARSCHGHAIHPTQKPVGIIAPLLAYSCPPGGLVLEPFGGACSVAVAARASGRRCVSVEVRADYFAKAARRC
jgi:site-specific DNA-methyltransferase (adenine-specific)